LYSSLRTISLPPCLDSIDNGAFRACTALSSIQMAPLITTIPKEAFFNCRALVQINLPSALTTIGKGAFMSCTALKLIELPASITKIDDAAFAYCINLTSIQIPPSISRINKDSFAFCRKLKSINIPPSVKTINKRAFQGCRNLVAIVLPPNIATIEGDAFAYCGLTEMKLPPSITTIAVSAFRNNNNLKQIEASFNLPSPYTITIENSPDSLEKAFKRASFSPIKLTDVLNGDFNMKHQNDIFNDWKIQTRERDNHRRLPLMQMAANNLNWSDGLQKIFEAYMPAIEETDTVTGLELFMLAAVGQDSNMEAVYNLLKLNPVAIMPRNPHIYLDQENSRKRNNPATQDCKIKIFKR